MKEANMPKIAGWYVDQDDIGSIISAVYDTFGVTISISRDHELDSEHLSKEIAKADITAQLKFYIRKALEQKVDQMISVVAKEIEVSPIEAFSFHDRV